MIAVRDDDSMLTTIEAAALLGVPKRTLLERARTRKIHARPAGETAQRRNCDPRTLMWRREDMDRLGDRRKRTGGVANKERLLEAAPRDARSLAVWLSRQSPRDAYDIACAAIAQCVIDEGALTLAELLALLTTVRDRLSASPDAAGDPASARRG